MLFPQEHSFIKDYISNQDWLSTLPRIAFVQHPFSFFFPAKTCVNPMNKKACQTGKVFKELPVPWLKDITGAEDEILSCFWFDIKCCGQPVLMQPDSTLCNTVPGCHYYLQVQEKNAC